MEKKIYVRKKNKKCTICHEPCAGRLCRTCYERRCNKGKYKSSLRDMI
jgi:recombinational DNA repair protein RecR